MDGEGKANEHQAEQNERVIHNGGGCPYPMEAIDVSGSHGTEDVKDPVKDTQIDLYDLFAVCGILNCDSGKEQKDQNGLNIVLDRSENTIEESRAEQDLP